MIQEKDFLYRAPVKNALVTAPGKQVRNPEILVDLEGGEFMHGDILDANYTNKLIDQSVKDAIDNSIENGNYVTKDLLEAETSARTKSDEDLNAKIKAEQTRAEGKEKEISDKLANEVTRATGVENDLRTAIDTKADATALSNYVLTTALNQQIDTLNTAISDKQDAGNYVPYTQYNGGYEMEGDFVYDYTTLENAHIRTTIGGDINMKESNGPCTYIHAGEILVGYPGSIGNSIDIYPKSIIGMIDGIISFTLTKEGLLLNGGDNNHVLTSCASTIDITQYALKTELPTVPTNVSQLTNDSNFITQQDADAKYALANSLNTVNDTVSSLRVGLSKKQDKITVNSVDITDIETADITKLRTIVINLIDALDTSGLIRKQLNIE